MEWTARLDGVVASVHCTEIPAQSRDRHTEPCIIRAMFYRTQILCPPATPARSHGTLDQTNVMGRTKATRVRSKSRRDEKSLQSGTWHEPRGTHVCGLVEAQVLKSGYQLRLPHAAVALTCAALQSTADGYRSAVLFPRCVCRSANPCLDFVGTATYQKARSGLPYQCWNAP